MDQGTPEWFAARLGKATASRIKDVVAKGRANAASASRANYEAQLIVERLTGKKAEEYTNAAMDRGNELEADARNAYQFYTNNEVMQVGFVEHPTISMSGASPDGLVNSDGITQIKCRNEAKHIAYFLTGKISGAEDTQVQWEMACTKRAWCDFVNYHPAFPIGMQLFIKRIERDDIRIQELEKEVRRFLDEVAGKVVKLKTLYGE